MEDGEIFIDCRRRMLFAKHVFAAVTAIPRVPIQFIYYISMIGAIVQMYTHNIKFLPAIKNSFTDAFKSVFYILWIEAVLIKGIALTLLGNPSSLYYSQKRVGELQFPMVGGVYDYDTSTRPFFKSVMPCLSPITHIGELDDWLIWRNKLGQEIDLNNKKLKTKRIKPSAKKFTKCQIKGYRSPSLDQTSYLKYFNRSLFSCFTWRGINKRGLGPNEEYVSFDHPNAPKKHALNSLV